MQHFLTSLDVGRNHFVTVEARSGTGAPAGLGSAEGEDRPDGLGADRRLAKLDRGAPADAQRRKCQRAIAPGSLSKELLTDRVTCRRGSDT